MNTAVTNGVRSLALLGAFTLGADPCLAQPGRSNAANGSAMVLEVRSSQPAYALGDPVDLEIVVRNASTQPISIPAGFDVLQGFVGVEVAFGDGPFREYRGPGWGLEDATGEARVILGPKQRVATTANILFNHGSASGHLNPQAAAEIASRYLDEGYALPSAGRYRIRAVMHGGNASIWSEPIEIVVEQPTGEDAEVWNTLRSDPELGYFMQTGGPRGRSSAARRQQLISTVAQLVTYHPGSRYSEVLRERLSRYQDLVDDLARRGVIAR